MPVNCGMNKQKIYDQTVNWLFTHGANILFAFIALFAGLWFIRLVKRLVLSRFDKSSVDASLRPFLHSIITATLYVLLALLIIQILGLQMTIFAAIIGGLGVAAGLSLSGTLQNFASGVLILLLKPFKVGENILAQGNEGTVTAIQIFYTIITTFDHKTVIVPNSKLSNEVIVNLSRQGRRRLDIEIKFNYGIEFDTVRQAIERAIDASDAELADTTTRIGISALEPDGYKVIINAWLGAHDYYDNKFRLQELLMQQLKQSGIKLPGMA